MDQPDSFAPEYGVAEQIAPMLRRIVAPNPSPMTFRGTNTYLLGNRGIAVIDPGPDNPKHLQSILQAIEPGQFVSHILVTHTHLDHSPLSRSLSETCDVPIYGYGPATAGRSSVMTRLVQSGLSGGGEGVDASFLPDRRVADGDVIQGDNWQLRVIHTPGHIGNHICLQWEDSCFTADHVMGWASSLVSPPDGDLTDFMASCNKLMQQQWRVFFPGHGAPITAPDARLEWLVKHRQNREIAILSELSTGPLSVQELTLRVYQDTPRRLIPAAERNVLAHLIDLSGKSLIRHRGFFSEQSVFEIVQRSEE